MSASQSDHRNHAGPYGFGRGEIIALSIVIALAIAVIAFDSWHERQHPATWVIEDVLVQSPVTAVSMDSASVSSLDSNATRPERDYSDYTDINSADERALARLPGIGQELARRIMVERQSGGPFVSLADLQRVKGIGPRKAAMLSGWVRFNATPVPLDTVETP
jgi:hypothetical protein